MATSKKPMSKFMDDKRDDESDQSPPKWNEWIDSRNSDKFTRWSRVHVWRRKESADKGKHNHKRDHEHGKSTHPERDFTVNSPKSSRFSNLLKQIEPFFGPNHQDKSKHTRSIPSVENTISLPSLKQQIPPKNEEWNNAPVQIDGSP